MNAIESLNRAYFYTDVSRSARFYFSEINYAFNDAIQQYITKKMGGEDGIDPDNFQLMQQIRDDLSPLIKFSTTSPTDGAAITNNYYTCLPSNIVNPVDYYQCVLIMCTIDGVTTYARPTSYNESGPLFENSYMHPTNKKPYYNEVSGGYTIWRLNLGVFSSATMTYVKQPLTFSVGSETQLISSGVLTNLTTYYATQITVFNGVTYQIADSIVGNGISSLISGEVILASNTTPIELPDKVQNDICKLAAKILLKNIGSFDQAAAAESEAT